MHAPLRACLPLALLLLAACSPTADNTVADSPIAKANAELARLQAQVRARPRDCVSFPLGASFSSGESSVGGGFGFDL